MRSQTYEEKQHNTDWDARSRQKYRRRRIGESIGISLRGLGSGDPGADRQTSA